MTFVYSPNSKNIKVLSQIGNLKNEHDIKVLSWPLRPLPYSSR